MKKTLNLILALFLATVFFSISLNIAWANYPERPITFIVTFGPGGSTDLVVRALAKPLEKQLGQPVLVVNKPGGGTAVGATAIASAKPDGYTVGTTLWTSPALIPHTMDVSYDIDSFEYIIIVGRFLFGAAVKADSPFKTLKDLIDHAKQNPGKVKYGTPGKATPPHLAMVRLGKAAGVKWDDVAFKTGAEVAPAVLGGHIDLISGNPFDMVPFVQSGRMRVLVSMGDTRWKWLPDVPTARELGYDFDMSAYMGFGAPKGVPKPIMDKLRDAFKEASRDPEFLANLEKFYIVPDYKTGDEYRRLLLEENKVNEKLLLELGLHKSQKK